MKKQFFLLSLCVAIPAFAAVHTLQIDQSALIPNARFKIEFDTTGWGGDVEARISINQNGAIIAKNLPDNVSISGNKIMFDSGNAGLKEVEVQSLKRTVFKRGEKEIEIAQHNQMQPQKIYLLGNAKNKTFMLKSSLPENKTKQPWGAWFTGLFRGNGKRKSNKQKHKTNMKQNSVQQMHNQTNQQRQQMNQMQQAEQFEAPAPVMNDMIEARTHTKKERIERIRARRAHKKQLAAQAAAKRIERKRSWLRQAKGI